MTTRHAIALFFRGNVTTAALVGALLSLTSFASHSASADAPPNRYTLTTDTALDTFTTLTWQRAQSATTMNFSDAQSYCQTQTPSGWRLPSPKELVTIIDDGVAGAPTIDRTTFPATTPGAFWTGTAGVRGAGYAWSVDFNVAESQEDDDGNANASNLYHVRCVR